MARGGHSVQKGGGAGQRTNTRTSKDNTPVQAQVEGGLMNLTLTKRWRCVTGKISSLSTCGGYPPRFFPRPLPAKDQDRSVCDGTSSFENSLVVGAGAASPVVIVVTVPFPAPVKCGSMGSDCGPDPVDVGVDVVAVAGASAPTVRKGDGATSGR
jgi:hypothetical protein